VVALISVSLPEELVQRLDRVMKATGTTRSAFVEQALTEKIERDAEAALRGLGALRTRESDGPTGPLPADVLVAPQQIR
jgi:predicted DNA-binding protein